MICWKLTKICLYTIQTSVNFRSFAILASLLILRRSFHWCRGIFPNRSMPKVRKQKTRKKLFFSCLTCLAVPLRFFLSSSWGVCTTWLIGCKGLITLANHNSHRQSNEPIRTWCKYSLLPGRENAREQCGVGKWKSEKDKSCWEVRFLLNYEIWFMDVFSCKQNSYRRIKVFKDCSLFKM